MATFWPLLGKPAGPKAAAFTQLGTIDASI